MPTTKLISLLFVILCVFSTIYTQPNATEVMIQDIVTMTAWSPDSQLLAVSNSNGVKIYSPTLQELAHLQNPTNLARAVTWSPDSNLLAATNENTISIWSRSQNNTFTQIRMLSDATGFIHSFLSWSPDGEKLASHSIANVEDPTGSATTIHVWDTTSWNLINSFSTQQYIGDTLPVFVLGWNTTSTAIIHVDIDVNLNANGIRLSDALSGNSINFIQTTEKVTSFSLHPSGLLALGDTVSYGVYDINSGRWLYSFFGEGIGYVNFIQWDTNANKLLLSNNGSVEIRPLDSNQVIETLDTANYALDWSQSGTFISTVGFDSINNHYLLQVWDVSQLLVDDSIPTATPYPFNTPTSVPTSLVPTATLTPQSVEKIGFTQQISSSYQLFTIDLQGSNKTNISNSTHNESNAAWSPDGTRLAFTSTRDGGVEHIFVRNLATGIDTQVTRGTAPDYHPSWSPDGQRLVFTSRRTGL